MGNIITLCMLNGYKTAPIECSYMGEFLGVGHKNAIALRCKYYAQQHDFCARSSSVWSVVVSQGKSPSVWCDPECVQTWKPGIVISTITTSHIGYSTQ